MSSRWVADPTLAWTIALQAELRPPVSAEELRARLTSLPLTAQLATAPPGKALDVVTAPSAASLHAVVEGRSLVIGAQHDRCDGLGLLAVMAHLTGSPATSSARGVGERTGRSSARATRERLREVLLSPPAIVAAHGGVPGPGDAFARLTVEGHVGVAELVHAAVRAVRDFNDERHVRSTRITVAIGASRTGGGAPAIADHSALLRLRHLEDVPLERLRDLIRSAAPEPVPPGSAGGSRLVAAATTAAIGLMSPRLGSTLLVSHLGAVEAPALSDLAFYPVTGGGSGVSVGAVGHGGRTTITLRGRRHRHGAAALMALASRVRDALPS